MKNIILSMLLLFISVVAFSQERHIVAFSQEKHTHKGFHVELGLGPAFGTIENEGVLNGDPLHMEFSGTGVAFDLKIGGSIQENLMLTFDVISKTISGPKIILDGMSVTAPNDFSMDETMFGAGITYYMMPQDLIFSVTLGSGNYDFGSNNVNFSSDYGFAWQLKFGKHWWISRKWGIGLCGTYGSCSATNMDSDNAGNYEKDNFSSSRYTILVSIGLK